MTSQPPSPTSLLRTKFDEFHLPSCTRSSRKHLQGEETKYKRQSEFHLFSNLPTELRLKIYTLSLPSPRLVPIHYLSATACPHPSISTPTITYPHPTLKRICRPTMTTPAQKNEWNKEWAGCTSTAEIPALLHVCQESRALASRYYKLSFRLTGPEEMFEDKIWFSTPSPNSDMGEEANGYGIVERKQDILYFPPLPGYLATIIHWEKTLTLLPSLTLYQIQRLAVHEDLFLEENKRRRLSQDSGLDLDDGESVSWGYNGGGRTDGVDTQVEDRLRDFWEVVRRRFKSVDEVWIVGEGRERDILSPLSSSWSPFSWRNSLEQGIDVDDELMMCKSSEVKGRESFRRW